MTRRPLDREMFNAYIEVLHPVDPEEADRLTAAYENTTDNDEEIAGMLLEALHSHDLIPFDTDTL